MAINRLQGFTLLEVMVALAILAGVAASIVQTLASGVEVTQSVEKESQAYILAASKMNDLLLLDDVQTGAGSGSIENTAFRYVATVEPADYPGAERKFVLWHIVLTVLWGEGDYQSSVVLQSLKSQAKQ